MSATFCWWCNGALVGKGGKPGHEPLFYRTVKTTDGVEVRVHVQCEQTAKDFLTVMTAQPTSGSR